MDGWQVLFNHFKEIYMSKRNLSKMALMGLTSGIILSGNAQASPLLEHSKDLDQMLAVINSQTYGREPHSSCRSYVSEDELPMEHVIIEHTPVTPKPVANPANKTKPATNNDKTNPVVPKKDESKKTPVDPKGKLSSAANKALQTKLTAEKVVQVKEAPKAQGGTQGQTTPKTPDTKKPSEAPKSTISSSAEHALRQACRDPHGNCSKLTVERTVQIKNTKGHGQNDAKHDQNDPSQSPAEGQSGTPTPENVKKIEPPKDALSFFYADPRGTSSEIIADNEIPHSSPLKAEDPSDEKKKSNEYKDDQNQGSGGQQELDPSDGNMGYHLLSDEELTLELTEQGMAMYNKLSPEEKELAREVASGRCNGTNKCEHLNACRTEKNECAGKGKCKGQGKCAFSDKNVAVKLVYDKVMAAKRAKLNH
jgi:hypothetical protein